MVSLGHNELNVSDHSHENDVFCFKILNFFLLISGDSKDVFARLQHLEDRILYLESLSPEYFTYAVSKSSTLYINHLF